MQFTRVGAMVQLVYFPLVPWPLPSAHSAVVIYKVRITMPTTTARRSAQSVFPPSAQATAGAPTQNRPEHGAQQAAHSTPRKTLLSPGRPRPQFAAALCAHSARGAPFALAVVCAFCVCVRCALFAFCVCVRISRLCALFASGVALARCGMTQPLCAARHSTRPQCEAAQEVVTWGKSVEGLGRQGQNVGVGDTRGERMRMDSNAHG